MYFGLKSSGILNQDSVRLHFRVRVDSWNCIAFIENDMKVYHSNLVPPITILSDWMFFNLEPLFQDLRSGPDR